jgi:hypothetical protein
VLRRLLLIGCGFCLCPTLLVVAFGIKVIVNPAPAPPVPVVDLELVGPPSPDPAPLLASPYRCPTCEDRTSIPVRVADPNDPRGWRIDHYEPCTACWRW